MKVKHNMTYKKKQYRPNPKKQKTKRFNPKPRAKSSYRHFKKPIKRIQRIQRGGNPVYLKPGAIPGLPTGWIERKAPNGNSYYVAEGKASTWDRPKHDQWFYGDVSFPPITDQKTTGTKFQLQVNTVFDNNGVITYTGLPVFFESSNTYVASITSNQVGTFLNINNPGTVTIWAGQQGNERFKPTEDWKSNNSSRTFNVYLPPPAYYPPPPPPAHTPAHAYPTHSAPPAHFPPPPPPAYYPPPPPPQPAYHAPTPAHTHTPAQQSMSGLHDLVFRFDSQCDPTLSLDHQSAELKKLISDIQTNPTAYNPNRGHTFLYSAFRGTGNKCLIGFMLNPLYHKFTPSGSSIVRCDIMQPNKPMPKWVWESDDGKLYSPCEQEIQTLLETTLVSSFVNVFPSVDVTLQGTSQLTRASRFDFDRRNITTIGTQFVTVQSVGTKTDIIVSRDITTGKWTWFMDEEQFDYPVEVSRVLETEFKAKNGNGFCKFDNPPIISNPGQPTVTLKQVKFTTNAVLRQTSSHSSRSVIRVCDTSYPFHGAIERLRTARNLDEALRHGENIQELAGMVHDMHIIKTLKNDIFYPNGTKHAFMAIDELLAAKSQLLSLFNNPGLRRILDRLVNTFSIQSKDKDETIGKPLTPCTNVRVINDDKIEIIIDSRRVEISIGSFIEFDRWVFNYNPTLTISLVKTTAIVTHFGGSFDSTDHKKSSVNRIFYLPWREDERRWTTSSYPRAIGLTSGYLNEYWDTIKVTECPSPTLCTIDAITKWQNE